jgi:flagellar motor switch protein FliM
MANEFLTQDEVDALLKGVSEEDAEPAAQQAPQPGVKPYDLAAQERIVGGRMPVLETINERFGRLLRTGIDNFMRRSVEISVGPVVVQKYGEFVRSLAQPTNLNLVQVKPLRGTSLFIFDPSLVFLIVDNLFGGDGRFQVNAEGREFTLTEQRIIQRLLGVVFDAYQASWNSVHKLQFEFMRSEQNTQFANIATPGELVVTSKFTLELGSAAADLSICMPYSMLEPIRDALFSNLQSDNDGSDRRWVHMLSKQVQSAEVELVAELGGAELTFGQVMQLKVGDIVPLEIPKTVTPMINGMPIMECQYGIFNRQYSLRVVRMIDNGPHDAVHQSASNE